ncbi:hypothetical protein [Neobacillus sp.]|uniref:hypothetical protein n=1 Tax=Neobacillus sp. TaxID=2675273 RepID=UPI0028998C41|nr:hypothetical protein [Neobacillus sp.]
MKAEAAKRFQRIFWHVRWLLLAGLIIYNLYSLMVAFKLSSFLPVNGFIFALFFFFGLWEDYFECKSSCEL